ncbi:flagellar basal-body MS-ring/collar protein FliF [Desulfurivibrio dismutans]|uniref:flagellar basal-body MS-ring/collar protein FliF n=1 Tax=Desulfurivibrio dismutans TaxID=1398908 RepID=UPI0023DCA012|nr:flagellar basal-body MS-ring/collar protein FliF [Desulfurivibrio alkaliphilus]MDF1614663.1 flagellar basal-body MS-ring/collar protein FliF [Desulfurivibrio alkaliphilus]
MAGPREIFEQIVSIFNGLSGMQKITAAVVVAVVFGGLVALTTVGTKMDERVLFSGLTQEDAAEVVQRLREINVPYRLSDTGEAILVPAGQVYEVRLGLAGEGLPRGGGVGFEVFDEVGLGTTDFVNRLNFQRALQGELSRTIRQFQQVQEARVHIATPKESVFIEDEKPVTASVSVRMRGREQLSQHQVQSIVNLVASAVPGLSDENITLVDTAGRLLYRKRGDLDSVLSGTQLEFQHSVETAARRKVESMLEEVVGVNRVRASVTADIDFSRVNLTEEIFDPEEQVIRSEQILSETDERGERARGIPGVKGELATFAGEDGAVTGSAYERSNVTRNYEISRQTRQVQETGGGVRRLSVAVMVDGTYERVVDEDGRTTLEYRPRSSEEMAYFERLVRNAVGYDEERGDQVEVVSMAFALSALEDPEVDPMEQWRELAEWLAMPVVYLLIALAVILFVVRPFLRLLAAKDLEAKRAAQMTASRAGGGAGEQEEEDLTLGPKGLTDQERIYRLAQSDPDRAADLVRRWLREEV